VAASVVWRLLLAVAVGTFLSLFVPVGSFRLSLGIVGTALIGAGAAHRLSGEPTPPLVKGEPSPTGFQLGLAAVGASCLAAAFHLVG